MKLYELKQLFSKTFPGAEGARSYHSPGRVNLIGEHTDYNGGFVFPCSLNLGTYGIAAPNKEGMFRLRSVNSEITAEFSPKDIEYKKEHDWGNYIKGVVLELQKSCPGREMPGLDIYFAGNIPNGAGLSSSASIELLTAVICNDFFNLGLEMPELAALCQKAENRFVGVNCGIMDQFAVGMGKENMAILLDCSSLKHEYIPLDLKDVKIIIANTNKRRGLADSKYNERRAECEKAVEIFKESGLGINCLGEMCIEMFEDNKFLIKDSIVRKRAEHVVYEDYRTQKAAAELKDGNLAGFGLLMDESHNSLRDLYEVTGAELDALVDCARATGLTLGARMTGAGFGGCTVNLVRQRDIETFIRLTGKCYEEKIGYAAEFYTAATGEGAKRIG